MRKYTYRPAPQWGEDWHFQIEPLSMGWVEVTLIHRPENGHVDVSRGFPLTSSNVDRAIEAIERKIVAENLQVTPYYG